MNTLKTFALGALAVAAMACTQPQTGVASGEAHKVGYIRIDSLMNIYDYHQELADQYEAKAQQIQAELVRGQENLQAEYEVLQNAAPRLSKLELERAQVDFPRVQNSYQQLEQQRAMELQTMEAEINAEVKEEMDRAVAQLQKEGGYHMVMIYETNLLYGDESMDLTADIAKILNSFERNDE